MWWDLWSLHRSIPERRIWFIYWWWDTCSSHYILTDVMKSLPSPLTHHQVPMDVDGKDGDCEILLGHDIVEECSEQQCRKKKMRSREPLTENEINNIQKCLGAITRLTWHWGPPINLSNAAHSKLKAEQWRLSIEFNLPVTLFKKWGLDCDEDIQSAWRKKLAHSTMLLAMAVRWGTSHVTSENHATQLRVPWKGRVLTCTWQCAWILI